MVNAVNSTPPNGYRLIIPPGWVRIPLRNGTEQALEELMFSRLKQLPPEVSKDDGMNYRLALRRSVTRQVADARKAGGLDLYLPLTTRYGISLAGSFLVSEYVTDPAEGVTPEVLLTALLSAGEGAVAITLNGAGGPAVRREHIEPPHPEHDLHVATRRVEYTLLVPHDESRMLSVVFSTPGDGAVESRFTSALVELFDASMQTFRWQRDGADLVAVSAESEQDASR